MLEMQIPPSTTVRQLKDQLLLSMNAGLTSQEKDLNTKNLAIIFAGKALQDDHSLQECLIRDATILHVARSREDSSTPTHDTQQESLLPGVSTSKSDTESDHLIVTREQAASLQCAFYGYCRESCSDVTAVLLRFACDKCGGFVFVVDPITELDTWEDILDGGKVHGVCYKDDCDGTDANLIFKCAAHQSRGQSDRMHYLRQIKLNLMDIACTTCGDVKTPVITFSCDPSHIMCLSCFQQYCAHLLAERRFTWVANLGSTARCPFGCADGLIVDPHHFYVLGRRLYENYKDFAAEECFLRSGGTYCSTCGAPFVDESSNFFTTCPNGHRFCRKCGDIAHAGECDALPPPEQLAVSEKARENAHSRQTILSTTKPCPGCAAPIERNGGCMHVICARCKKEFCWICQTDWGIDCMSRHWFA
ncbi:E3 ubiquitin-protein ligase parkin [Hypsibius exemplaris]|uniref:E3 ubiquitin-protein ligase parkin n=1 Tax=Hypsibius exemplaris TaxID=2072580 RepID=A0A9X6ND10_HYPEX|nr:E3 ubiquitin-protein ligase parkin [Hypsibius exemplaris]